MNRFKFLRRPADRDIMKAIFIILLFPSVTFAFYKGIPYQNTDICQKVKDDYHKAMSVRDKNATAYNKAKSDLVKAKSDYDKVISESMSKVVNGSTKAKDDMMRAASDMDKIIAVRNKAKTETLTAIADIDKAFKDSEKYKCFKQTPACNESVKDLAKTITDISRFNAGLSTAVDNVNKYCK